MTRIVRIEWARQGAPPEALIEAFAEAALMVAVLEALLEDPAARAKALHLGHGMPAVHPDIP